MMLIFNFNKTVSLIVVTGKFKQINGKERRYVASPLALGLHRFIYGVPAVQPLVCLAGYVNGVVTA